MIFSAKNKKIPQHSPLTINNEIIKQSHQERYLGLQLDDKLTWKCHIDKVRSKLISLNGALRKVIGCIPSKVRMTIYNSLVKSHIDYLVEVWGCAAESNLKTLQISQNKIIKTLFKYNRLMDTKLLYEKTKLLNLKQTYTYTTCILIRKILTNKIHTELSLSERTFKHQLRNANKISLITPRINHGKYNIMFEGAQMYNNLPNDIKDCNSFGLFKSKLKKYIYEKVF